MLKLRGHLMTRAEILTLADAAASIQAKVDDIRNLLYNYDGADDVVFMRMNELEGAISGLSTAIRYMLDTNHEPITAQEIRP